jgi:hypothetical protein
MIPVKKRPGQFDDETAIEYLRRVVHSLNYETDALLSELPTPEALLQFFDLWHTYGTDCWSGIQECIAEGDDPKPARTFARHWHQPFLLEDIREAVKIAKKKS